MGSQVFVPLPKKELERLDNALRRNGEEKGGIAMSHRDTTFIGTVEDVTDEEVISVIKSVPTHY